VINKMNFTILTPGDSPVKDDKSSPTVSNFGGHRAHSNSVSDAKDYTKRTGNAPTIEENPTDTAVRDIDDMADPAARKREFSRREETSNTQLNNESSFITKSDSDNLPPMDTGSDATVVPETHAVKQTRKPNQWHFGTKSVYEGEIS